MNLLIILAILVIAYGIPYMVIGYKLSRYLPYYKTLRFIEEGKCYKWDYEKLPIELKKFVEKLQKIKLIIFIVWGIYALITIPIAICSFQGDLLVLYLLCSFLFILMAKFVARMSLKAGNFCYDYDIVH